MEPSVDVVKADILQRIFELLFVHRDIERASSYLAENLERITAYSAYAVLRLGESPPELSIHVHEPVGPVFVSELQTRVVNAAARLGARFDVANLPSTLSHEERVESRRRGVPRSLVNIPIFEDKGLLCIISVASARAGLYKSAELAFLSNIAEMLARTYSSLRSDVVAREHELVRLREQELVKDKFLSAVSHELRSPLTILSGLLEMLLEGEPGSLNPQQYEFVGSAMEQATRLKWLMGNLLDLSRIEYGTLDMSREPAMVGTLLDKALHSLRYPLERKGLRVEVEAGAESLPPICVDPNRVTQVLVNLVDNASKYTPQGGVVRLRARSLQPVSDHVEFAIIDNGRGIPAEDQRFVFDRFYRLGRQVRGAAGTGLGLNIAKEIVESHNGRIWVESVEGSGSTFFFTLPIYDAERSLKAYLQDVLGRARENQSPLTFIFLAIDQCPYDDAEQVINDILRSSESVFHYAAGGGALVLSAFTELTEAERTAQRFQSRLAEQLSEPHAATPVVRYACQVAQSASTPQVVDAPARGVIDATVERVMRAVRKFAARRSDSGVAQG
jgi:signal transduction histidine kinase